MTRRRWAHAALAAVAIAWAGCGYYGPPIRSDGPDAPDTTRAEASGTDAEDAAPDERDAAREDSGG